MSDLFVNANCAAMDHGGTFKNGILLIGRGPVPRYWSIDTFNFLLTEYFLT